MPDNKKNEIVPNNKKNEVVPNNKVAPNNKNNKVVPNNKVAPNNKKNEVVPNNKKVTPQNRFKKAVGKISTVESIKKAGANIRRRNNAMKKMVMTQNRFKKAVGKVGAIEALKKAGTNTKNRKELVSNLVSNAMITVTTNNKKPIYNNSNSNTENNIKPKNTVIKSPTTINNPIFENTPNKPVVPNFNASEELNKQLNIKGKELNKANTNKKIRNGVEFKIKQIEGLTNENVTEFMKKWNTTKNPFTRKSIFNQARKRGEGRLKGKKVKNERNKPKQENDFNASAAINKLNMAPKKNSLMKKAKNEVGRFAGRIGKWDPAIKNAKNNATLTNLENQMNKKIELRKEIQTSKIGPLKKRGHLEKVMQLKNNVGQRRKIFEEQLTNLSNKGERNTLKKYIQGLNIPRENKSGYVKRINAPNANLTLIRASVNKQVNQKISNASKSLVAGAIGKIQANENKNIVNASKSLVSGAIEQVKKNEAATKIQAVVRGKKNRNMAMNKKRTEFTELAKKTSTNFSRNIIAMKNMKNAFKLRGRIEGAVRKNVRPMVPITVPLEENGEISTAALTPKPPNVSKPNKPSFRALVQKNKEKRFVNSVKLAGKKTALSAASGAERIKMARNLAPTTQNNVKKATNATKIFDVKAKAVEMTNIDRIKKSGEAAEAKRKLKAEQRKANKKLAKTTGQSVKSTQKKQQVKRKSATKKK